LLCLESSGNSQERKEIGVEHHDTDRPGGLAKASEVAEYLTTSTHQLARLRFEGQGPHYVKLGRSVRYRWEDVHRWVNDNLQAVGGGAV